MSSVYALAGSMVIKDHSFAEAIENSIIADKIKLGLEINPSHSKWKYYLNLSGEYHDTDDVMTIVSLDTLEEIEFTKENLVVHRSTKKGYLTEDKYVKELLERYPDNNLLIKSILNPVEIDKAVSSDDFTILQWDANEVEIQENGLIDDVQTRINTFKENWHNEEFNIFDKGYYIAFYQQLIAVLPLFIVQSREVNEFTYKVHSYYLWSYLETKAGLYKYKDYLSVYQANWLYRNINYVLTNLGKKETLDELVNVLLTEKSIPIGRYVVDHLTEQMDTQVSLRPTAIAKKHPMNLLSFVGKEARDKSLEYLLKLEIPRARSNIEDLDYVIEETEDKLSGYVGVPLKVLETDVLSSSENAIYSLEETLIYHWAFFSDQGLYLSRFFIRNGKTGGVMTVDSKSAFILYYYLLALRAGSRPTTFPTIELRDVINPAFDPDQDMELYGDEVPLEYLELFNSSYPSVSDFISSESFREACVEYHRFLILMNAAIEFPDNHITRNWYREYMHRRLLNGVLTLDIPGYDTIQAWFAAQNWDLEDLDFASIESTLLDIETKVLSVDSGIIDASVIQQKMTALVDELTSYNIQVMSSGNLQDVRLNQTTVPEIGEYSTTKRLDMYSETIPENHVLSKRTTTSSEVELNTAQCDSDTRVHLNFEVDIALTNQVINTTGNLGSVDII